MNHDVEDILVLSEHLSNLLHSFSLPQEEESSAYTENLDDSIPELSSNLIHSTILGYGIPSDAMHTADKLEILRSLEAQGVFQTKGYIGQVARELHISEPTVYRLSLIHIFISFQTLHCQRNRNTRLASMGVCAAAI